MKTIPEYLAEAYKGSSRQAAKDFNDLKAILKLTSPSEIDELDGKLKVKISKLSFDLSKILMDI